MLARNEGDGTFSDVSTSPINSSTAAWASAWADYDNDGDLDLYVGYSGLGNQLFRNDGGGTFADVSVSPINPSGGSDGLSWGDYDNDGDQDLFTSTFAVNNALYQNNGGTFTSVGAGAGIQGGASAHRGAVWADYDNDGDLDILVAVVGSRPLLFKNDGVVGDWLKVALEGTASNEFGHGATVKAYAPSTTQLRVVDTGSGRYSSQAPATVHFGMNGFATVDSVDVIWPNGYTQRITSVTKNALLTVTETSAPEGLFIAGLDFDGTDDYVSLPNLDFSGGSIIAIEAWVKPADITTNTYYEIIRQELTATTSPDFLLAFQDNGTTLAFGVRAGGTYTELDVTVTPGDYTDGNWHHVAAVYDGTNQYLYSDGVLIGSGAKTGTVAYSAGAFNVLGSRSADGTTYSEFFEGQIDDVRIWSVVRPRSDIAQNMNHVLVGNESGLVANWRLDEQVGTVANDETGANDGQLYNMDITSAWVPAVHTYEIVANAPSVHTGILPGIDVDGDALTFSIQTNGTKGTAAVTNASTGAFTYTPTNSNGAGDSFVYRIADGTTNVDKTVNVINLSTTFIEVASTAGVDDASNIRGVAWGDYDGDGDLDLYLANMSVANVLYRNDGGGSFSDQTGGAPLNDAGAGHTPIWGDYDSDGDLDLYLALGTTNRLFRNDGGGTFTDQATGAGVADASTGIAPLWGDIDNDGDLDLYVTNVSTANRMYSNDGDATFTDLGGTTASSADGYSAAFGDYDDDGDLDLYLSNSTANVLFQNDGTGSFSDVTSGSPLNDANTGRGISWGDYDADGDLDIYLANAGQANLLLKNNSGTFANVGSAAQVADANSGHATTWADVDNDGDLDLYLTNADAANRLYANNGDGTFTDVGVAAGATDGTSISYGVTVGDYDSDGDVDLYVANSSTNQLYRNEGNSNKWLTLTLEGSNHSDGIGAQVFAVTGSVRQRLDVDGGSGYTAQPSLPLEFGFGSTATVDSLIIKWPSGKTFDTTNVATNQALTIEENVTLFTDVTAAPVDNTGNSYGAAWGDYDGDGDLDLYSGNNAASKLFKNTSGTFSDDTATAGMSTAIGSFPSAAWADYDNDGDLDMYVGTSAANVLYQNNGSGVFTNQAVAAGVVDGAASGYGVSWGDYDDDGDLDLYVANYNAANLLYRNNDDGTFTDQANTLGVDDGGQGNAAAWADYDDDGDLDLALANEATGNNRLFRNDGGTSFVDQAVAAGLDATLTATNISWADYDRDGDPDLLLSGKFYKNNGNSTFTEVTAASGISGGSPGWADYDNDGDLDLYIGKWQVANHLYLNRGDGVFDNVASAAGVDDAGSIRTVTFGDYDGDGDLDLYLANDSGEANILYRNDGNANKWLQVVLTGTVSNVSAIGAEVRAWVGGNSRRRDVDGGVGRWGQQSLPVEFGFGATTSIDSLVIDWPAGTHQVVVSPTLDQTLSLIESASFMEVAASKGMADTGPGWGVAWMDYDNDDDLDLFVANKGAANKLYSNDGSGSFTSITGTPFNDTGSQLGVAFGDYDNDGDLDVYMGAILGGSSKLLRNDGGTYVDVSVSPINTTDQTANVAWADYDRDGDLDLLLSSGQQQPMPCIATTVAHLPV